MIDELLASLVQIMFSHYLQMMIILGAIAAAAFLFALFGHKLLNRIPFLRVLAALLIGSAHAWLCLGILHEISGGDAFAFPMEGTTLEKCLDWGALFIAGLMPVILALVTALMNEFTVGKAFAVLLVPLFTIVVLLVYILVAGIILVSASMTLNNFLAILISIPIFLGLIAAPGAVIIVIIGKITN